MSVSHVARRIIKKKVDGKDGKNKSVFVDENGQQVLIEKSDYMKTSGMGKVYSFQDKIYDPRFGDVSKCIKSQDEAIYTKETKSNNKKDLEWEVRNAKQRMNLHHNNLIDVLDWSTSSKSDFCSKMWMFKWWFQMPRNDLKREIHERKKKQVMFSDEEVT